MLAIKESLAVGAAELLVQPLDTRGQRAVGIGQDGQLSVNLHLYNEENHLLRKAKFGSLMDEAVEALMRSGRVDAICSMGEQSYIKACAETAGRSYLVVSADLRWVNISNGRQPNSTDNGLLIVPQLSLVRRLPDLINRFRDRPPKMQVRSILAVVGDGSVDTENLQNLGVNRIAFLTDVSHIREALPTQ